jgi:hypothetical protein
MSKNCPKICPKFVNGCQKFGKGSGEEDEDEEEDWWLLDQVATSSHLEKIIHVITVFETTLPAGHVLLCT